MKKKNVLWLTDFHTFFESTLYLSITIIGREQNLDFASLHITQDFLFGIWTLLI